MQETEEQITETNKATSFAALRNEGVEMLQAIASASWTDYNEHDPGITILELLCYAVTDIGYRSNFPIRDLLTTESGTIDAEGNTFYTAAEALTTNPVTTNDYRKLLISNFEYINNAWVIPGKEESAYGIFIELKEDYDRKDSVDKEKKNGDILRFINAYRNLCEQFGQVKILQPIEIVVSAEININDVADANSIVVNILLQLNDYLSAQVKIYSYAELQNELPTDIIFDGPRLSRGFIKSEELLPIMTEINITGALEKISSIPGITSIKDISFGGADKLKENAGNVPQYVPRLNVAATLDNISLTTKNVKAQFDKATVQSLYHDEINKQARPYKANKQVKDNDIPIQSGKFRNVQKYYSIQNEFPSVYGIGENGIPASSGNRRIAQAKQLKAYLLLFEQIMANELAQLANVDKLFSHTGKPKNQYYQMLREVPNIAPLLKVFTDENTSDDAGANNKQTWNSYLQDDKNSYLRMLDSIWNNDQNAYKKRNTFLDHLLARFNESVSKNKPAGFSLYSDDKEAGYIDAKEKMLANFIEFSSSRSRAAVIQQNANNNFKLNSPVLEKKIKLRLNIDNDKNTPVNEIINEHLHFESKNSLQWLNNVALSKDNFRNFEEILQRGIDNTNYSVVPGSIPGQSTLVLSLGNGENISLLNTNTDNPVLEINTFRDRLVDKFREINTASESVYVVEHLLLGPNTVVNDDDYEHQKATWANPLPGGDAGANSFYQNRLSIIIGSYSARFAETTFFDFVQKQVTMVTPAHIQADILFLNMTDTQAFESLYEDWLKQVLTTSLTDKTASANKLAIFLQTQKSSRG